ncbi:MAG: DNA polymerase III subunit delta [Ilumatobacter sp.]|nr:DNA polymerase III subunit delta [Ilumatobacter sp.]
MATHLLTGDDESILRTAVHDLVHDLIGDGDRSMMVDEFDGEEYEVRHVVDAAQTPPFLTDKRVIVARGIGRFVTDDLTPLLAYLDNPLDTSDLVLVGGEGRIAKKLTDAVKAAGTITNTSPPSRAKDRQSWLSDHIAETGLRLDGGAIAQLGQWLGEDAGRVDGILATLRSTFGDDRKLTFADIEPFLGEAGGVPPWDFTDAIDGGRTTTALDLLARMMHGGGRHPLQIMSILHTHYANLAKLDGAGAVSEQEAMAATGIKSAFPAKKALQNYRRLGGPNVKRAVELLAQADLDLRGARDLDADLVMEVLVARLSKLR